METNNVRKKIYFKIKNHEGFMKRQGINSVMFEEEIFVYEDLLNNGNSEIDVFFTRKNITDDFSRYTTYKHNLINKEKSFICELYLKWSNM